MAVLEQDARSLDLHQAVEHVQNSGDVAALATISARLLHELERADDSSVVNELLKSLIKGSRPENVAVFLHVFAATNALQSSKAIKALSDIGIEPAALLEYLNSERLVEAGLVDASLARKRYQRFIGLETRTMTFDLNRDCTYGYAELAVLLTRASRLDNKLWHSVLELVGIYSLEPFRVLCTMIDLLVFRNDGLDLENLEWLAQSDWRGHPDLPAVLNMFLEDPLGVQLAARLTVLGAVSFSEMFSYFDPKLEGFRDYEREYREEQLAATQSGVNALAMSAMLGDDDDEEDEIMDGDDRLHSEEVNMEESGTDTRPSEEPSEFGRIDKMQTALLFLGEIFANGYPHDSGEAVVTAMTYVNAFPIVAGSSDSIASGLSKLACHLFDCEGSDRNQILQISHKYLTHITHNLGEDVWQAMNTLAAATFDESPEFWTDFFREFMLPSLDFENTSDSILWRFDSQQRFELYNDLQMRVARENFFVKTRFAKAEKETKNILKRLTKIDAETKTVPALLEVFGQCPLPSLAAFVNQVESYNIGSLVARSATTQIPPLAMDMLPLIIMQQLTTEGRLAQQQDGLYESRWFRLLASFTGEIASLHSEFDFLSIIGLILRQITEGDYTQIIVLEQLLLRLSGIPLKSNLSIPQVVALCSGSTVREITQAALTEQTSASRVRLLKSLEEHNILLEVFVALCHVYNHMLLEGTNAKVVVNRRDLVAELIIVYTELIGDSHQFDLVELCTKYAVPIQFALVLWRFRTKDINDTDIAEKLPENEGWSGKISTDLYLSFWHMNTYDIVFDENLYITVGDVRDPKIVEKNSLSHKLRLKSVKQKLNSSKDSWFSAPSGEWNTEAIVNFLIVPRVIISPVDAVYTSRFIQLLHEIEPAGFNFSELGDTLFSRGVILSILHTASPLELESFAIFISDLFEYLLRHNEFGIAQSNWSHVLTKSLLEVAVPTQNYIPLSNAFSLLQKTTFVFPLFSNDGEDLLRRIHILTVSLTDGDLETSVKSLYAQLTRRKALWLHPDAEDVKSTDFYKAMELNSERLQARLLASLRSSNKQETSQEKQEPAPKRARRNRNSERKEKKNGSNGGKREENDDLLMDIERKDRPQSQQGAPKRYEDNRPKKNWAEKRERSRRRRDAVRRDRRD